MRRITIKFCSLDDVLGFISTVGRLKGKVFIYSGMYRVDAKSVVGILSLDLKQPLSLEIEEWEEEYMFLLERYFDKETERMSLCK